MKINSINSSYGNYKNNKNLKQNTFVSLADKSDSVSFSGKSKASTNLLKAIVISLAVATAGLTGCAMPRNSSEAQQQDYSYTVQEGDSLSSIVRQYIGDDANWDKVSYYVDELASLNNIEDPSILSLTDEYGNPTVLDISCLIDGSNSNTKVESYDIETSALESAEEDVLYTVKDGDTLASIVRQYIGEDASWTEVSSYVETLAADNNIEDVSNIKSKDKDGNPVVLNISSLINTGKVTFSLPSSEVPVKDADGNIIASIKKVTSNSDGPLSGTTIMVNAGHGGFNPSNNYFDIGASNSEVKEYELTNRYTEMLAQKLVDEGADVIICQGAVNGGSKSPVGNAIQDFADEYSNDKSNTAFVSIHFDAYDNTSIKGGSVRYQDGRDSEFAQILCDSLKSNGIGLFKEEPVADNLLVTNTASSNGIKRAVLIECATISNSEDSDKAQTEEFKEQITDAIVEGIIKSFE